MEAISNTKLLKVQDPIWKRLFVSRIYTGVYLIIGAYVIYSTLANTSKNGNITLNFFSFPVIYWAFLLFILTLAPIRQERYWRRIGERRIKILHGKQDTQSLLANYQIRSEEHALEVPTHLHLIWKRTLLIAIGVFAGIVVLLLVIIGIVIAVQNNSAFNVFLLVSLMTLIIILALLLPLYFTVFRYQGQAIEISNEGIRTRYLLQERFLSWDEARLFAVYGAQGVNKSFVTTTYELSNEQVVVRWSQRAPTSIFMKVESSNELKEDWNWLVSRVNAYVAARTKLPLLDLSDKHYPRPVNHTKKGLQQTQQHEPSTSDVASSPITVKIAQNDPVLSRLNLRQGGGVIAVFGGIGLLSLLVVCYGKFWSTDATRPGILDATFLNFLFYAGILAVCVALLLLWLMQVAAKNLKRIQGRRQQAILHPERFQSTAQPVPSSEQPQPASIQIVIRKKSFFLLSFVETFILWFVFELLFFSPSSQGILHNSALHVFATLVISALAALLMSLFLVAITNQANRTRIEVNTNGIATYTGPIESHLRWQDARLFAKYRPQGLLKKNTRIWLYELASEETLVRWQWPRSQKWRTTMEPTMTQEEYEHWLDQLQKYVMAQAELPLLDLDAS